jgi:succinate-semialdehyde dehydrogenase/glutarate-semialdehyde dehydrogenase
MNAWDDLIEHGLAGDGLAVFNPADGQRIAVVRSWSASELPPLIEAAELARHEWAARTAKERSTVLRRWYDLVGERKEDLARLATAESGKPDAEARGEVDYAASYLEWYAEEAKRAYGEVIPAPAPTKRALTIRQPVGTCAAITPWNFPLAMVTRKAGPALAAGCSMILKPAEATPLSALALEHLAREAGVPERLFRVVPTTDQAEIGEVLCGHPLIRKLSFTGSTTVGKLLLRQCVQTVKRTSMELGGNAPLIVFEDADLETAIEGVLYAKFRNAGQTCICANRVLVQHGIYDRFTAMLAARVSQLRVGDGADAGSEIGPLINRTAVDKVARLVDNAVAQGARALTGGARHAAGENFFEPTVLDGVTSGMPVATEEVFGPVAPIIAFRDEAEALHVANGTPYGLAAYVYTRDVNRIWRMMESLAFGMVGVNETAISAENVPFGGIKESGFGREGARQGLEEYLETKYVMMGVSA